MLRAKQIKINLSRNVPSSVPDFSVEVSRGADKTKDKVINQIKFDENLQGKQNTPIANKQTNKQNDNLTSWRN